MGAEFQIELATWQEALERVPDEYLDQAWCAAAEGHDWNWPFSPDLITAAYRNLVMQEREKNRDATGCSYCRFGYQNVWHWDERTTRWYLAVRTCSCDAAPVARRSESPLQGPDFVCGQKSGNWVRLADLLRHGVPASAPEGDFVTM